VHSFGNETAYTAVSPGTRLYVLSMRWTRIDSRRISTQIPVVSRVGWSNYISSSVPNSKWQPQRGLPSFGLALLFALRSIVDAGALASSPAAESVASARGNVEAEVDNFSTIAASGPGMWPVPFNPCSLAGPHESELGTTQKFSLVQQLRQLSGVQGTWRTRRLPDRLWP